MHFLQFQIRQKALCAVREGFEPPRGGWLMRKSFKWSTLGPISRIITHSLSRIPHPRDKRARLPVSSSHSIKFDLVL